MPIDKHLVPPDGFTSLPDSFATVIDPWYWDTDFSPIDTYISIQIIPEGDFTITLATPREMRKFKDQPLASIKSGECGLCLG